MKYKMVMIIGLLMSSLIYANESSCQFCNQAVLEKQKIYEDDYVMALVDYKPVLNGHCLVIPKRHVEVLQDLSQEETVHIHQAIAKLYQVAQNTFDSTGYFIWQKNGKSAGQSVMHVHYHFFPRKENDYTTIGILARILVSPLKSPLSEQEVMNQRNLFAHQFKQLEDKDDIMLNASGL